MKYEKAALTVWWRKTPRTIKNHIGNYSIFSIKICLNLFESFTSAWCFRVAMDRCRLLRIDQSSHQQFLQLIRKCVPIAATQCAVDHIKLIGDIFTIFANQKQKDNRPEQLRRNFCQLNGIGTAVKLFVQKWELKWKINVNFSGEIRNLMILN